MAAAVRSADGLRSHMIATYFALRMAMVVGALAVPTVCLVWTALDAGLPLQGSLSAYYYTPARNLVLGAIVGVGVCLIAYRGFAIGEDVLLNLAGICAVVLALCPTAAPGQQQMTLGNWVHVVSALGFFGATGLAILFYSRTTLRLLDARRARIYHLVYAGLCAGIFVLPIGAATVAAAVGPGHRLLGLEIGAICAFALYWLVKTHELHASAAETRIAAGDPGAGAAVCG